MKLWTRLMVAGLALVLAFSLVVGPADAASKKKKSTKKEVKKEQKKEVRHETRSMRSNHYIESANVNGRPGLFFSDTASTPAKGQIMAAVSPAFYSAGSLFSMPFGASFGVTKEIQLHASTAFLAAGGGSNLGMLVFGGKYGFHNISTPGLDIAAGLDFAVGPLTNAGYSTFDFNPYGVVTYTTKDGLTLNGQMGIYIAGGYSVTLFPGYTVTFTPPAAFQFNGGVAYPFDSELTGIGELAVNPGSSGAGNTLLLAGIRTGKTDVQLQAYGGLQFAGATGVVIGGSLILASK